MFGPTKRVLVNVKNFHPLASCIGSAKVFLSADSLQLPPRWMHAAPLHVSMISTWTQLHKIIMHNCQIRANILFQTYANIISTWNKILWTCACGGCCCIASHALKGSILFGQDLRKVSSAAFRVPQLSFSDQWFRQSYGKVAHQMSLCLNQLFNRRRAWVLCFCCSQGLLYIFSASNAYPFGNMKKRCVSAENSVILKGPTNQSGGWEWKMLLNERC